MKITKKAKFITSEYRIYKSEETETYSVIQVFLNSKKEIIGYSDYIIPTAKQVHQLKLMLSSMVKCSRQQVLTAEDLKSIKYKNR